jgi:hypothetical protein
MSTLRYLDMKMLETTQLKLEWSFFNTNDPDISID